MKVYGIKTCGSVKKALKFFNDNGIEYEFVDFKKSPVGCEKIDEWIKKVGINTLFNTRGTKYRQLKLKELNLDDAGKREWLCKENLLIKRPVIELNNGDVIVGFDEELYNKVFHGA
ncbi:MULTISPECIES: arsenate reductase family protein [unclassified Nitratiruptor]|uniref:arsenate reductase family protein n=1 Tax=unclassified Nitratiruptor TaxID=2624044 RepID=UPI0019169790|nr:MULTISPECIES: Spx/MgsR family RNA polymerase-binding regulatory protein [unclassified Nitratiruptor]BCD60236.1 arsenate reductase (glutaredoxin) [Nitratiruptor sp. YY08-10]BCD64275.1 arsenate reductase (glutaredoxin) [Nitratiruptor sp. YY08-14]